MITIVYKVGNLEFASIEGAREYERQLNGYQFYQQNGKETDTFDTASLVTFYSQEGVENINRYIDKTFGVTPYFIIPPSEFGFPITYIISELIEHQFIFIASDEVYTMHSTLENKHKRG